MSAENGPRKQKLTKGKKIFLGAGGLAALLAAAGTGAGVAYHNSESSEHSDPARYQINTSAALRYEQLENIFEKLQASIVVLKSEPASDSIVEDSDVWRVNSAQIKPISGETGTTTGEITILIDKEFTDLKGNTMRGLLIRDAIGDVITIDEIKSNKATNSISSDLLAPEDRNKEAITFRFNTKLVGSVSDLRSLTLYIETVDSESFQADPSSLRTFRLIRDPQPVQK